MHGGPAGIGRAGGLLACLAGGSSGKRTGEPELRPTVRGLRACAIVRAMNETIKIALVAIVAVVVAKKLLPMVPNAPKDLL